MTLDIMPNKEECGNNGLYVKVTPTERKKDVKAIQSNSKHEIKRNHIHYITQDHTIPPSN